MRAFIGHGLGLAVLATGLTWACEAPCMADAVIIYGHGEKMAYVGDLPKPLWQSNIGPLDPKLGMNPSVGYLYKRFHIFWCDLWTWGGRHVLYSGDNCWEPAPADWEELLGKGEREKLGKPFLYRFPLGLIVLGALAISAGLAKALIAGDGARARTLLADVRYKEALRLLVRETPPDGSSEAVQTNRMAAQEEAFAAAVNYLVDHGVPAHKAHANLQLILNVLANEAQDKSTKAGD